MAVKFIPSRKSEDIIPKGSNGISSKDKFRESIHYERYLKYLQSIGDYTEYSFFDSRVKDIDYGKLNNDGELIDIIPGSVVDVIGSKNVYVLPFVNDAFSNLKRMCASYGRSSIFSDKIFINLEAKSGFANFNSFYQQYMTSIYESFINYKSLKINNQNYTFNNFLKDFVLFLKYICDKSPFLRSSFYSSVNCGINFSGLSIEIDSIAKDKDEEKYSKYFTSQDFNNFNKLCQAHGFSIDKYCPWRLVFNFKNPNSLKYLEPYNLDTDNVYNKMFERTVDYDVDNLISYMVIFYNTFVDNINENNKSNFIDQIDIKYATTVYSKDFWNRLYFYILFLETKIDLNQQQYEQYVQNLSYTFINKNIDAAYLEFNKILKKHSRNNSKNFMFSF